MPIEYELVRPSPEPVTPPQLDASQQAVVDHQGGPLLVLAGPGTGKTTTLIEAVVDRIDNRGLRPEEVLVLTFSRKAADELKSRIATRLGRTTSTTSAMTFHSFCYALVREFQDPESYANPLRLLSAPEQDTMIRDLVGGTEVASWPKGLQPALRTRGFARELQDIMARARSLGMDADAVADSGVFANRGDWVAAGRFFDKYAAESAFANTIDYADLVFQALKIAQTPEHRDVLRLRFRFVVVDEYQDTDPLQVQLLKAIAGDGHDLIAVGDPDQSIYAFRGAQVTGILNFPSEFQTASGPAPILALGATRRFGKNILAASRAIIGKVGVAGHLDQQAFRDFRNIESLSEADGEVIVQTFATPEAEAEHLALMLREAHVRDQVPWGDIAVLVRSGRALPRLQRAFTAAGVPVEVAGDELPLAAEPAVRALLSALRVAKLISQGRTIDNDQAEAVLAGPLCQLDASALRRLGRALRSASKDADGVPRPSADLLVESLTDPVSLRWGSHPDSATSEAAAKAHRLAVLLRKAADQIKKRVAPEQVLWTLWAGTDWDKRLITEFESRGEGAGRAEQDLDALCALFSRSARSEEHQQRQTISAFVTELEAQQIPADTMADRGARGAAVHLMTAHRAKGLEWPIVIVAGVQDGAWPDIRYRGTLLQSDRLASDGQQHPATPASLLAEERRLFYVACTRASRRLVVTAVESSSESGEQPSRFLIELEPFSANPPVDKDEKRQARPLTRPIRPLSLRGAIAGLRTVIEETSSPLVRAEAAAQLARLAGVDSYATRGAHPDRWWGVLDLTDNDTPISSPDEPLKLSASSVSAILDCPLSWFLDREAKGGTGTSAAQGFGSIVHAIAADVIDSGIAADPVELESHLDLVWSQLHFAAPWISARERTTAREAIVRFANWHTNNVRTPLKAEYDFSVQLEIGGEQVVLRGSMDRVELAADGRVHVVDLKTSKKPPDQKDIPEYPQLGFYQLVVENGGVSEIAPGATAGGAELVQLRNQMSTKLPDYPTIQPQDPPRESEPFFATEQLLHAVHTIRKEEFPATPDPKFCGYCDFRRVCPAQSEGATILDGAS